MDLSKVTKETAVMYAVANPSQAVDIAKLFPSQAVAIAQALPNLAKDISVALPDQAVAIASIVRGPEESLGNELGRAAARFFRGAGTQLGELASAARTRGAELLEDISQRLEAMEQEPRSTVAEIALAHPDQAVAIAVQCPSEAVAIARALPHLAAKIAQAVPQKARQILEAVPGAKADFTL